MRQALPSVLAVLLVGVQVGSSYKVLVYNPLFAHSHSNFLGRLADILVEAGFDVTTFSPQIDTSINPGTKLSRMIKVDGDPQATKLRGKFVAPEMGLVEMNPANLFSAGRVYGILGRMLYVQCKATLNRTDVLESLAAENFDVLISESFDYCGIGISHMLGIKSLITVSSTSLFDDLAYLVGVPPPASYVPCTFCEPVDSSVWSRLITFIHRYVLVMWPEVSLNLEEPLFHSIVGKDWPGLHAIVARSAFVFTNAEPLLDFARPTLRKIVDIGGIGIPKAKPLDKFFNETLSLRPRTVLMSFGSITPTEQMSAEMKQSISHVLSQFPDVTFIWKHENAEDEEVAPNVVLTRWMPQNDLLNDPRVTAFISHAGMGSCQETAAHGVPAIFIPMFADQARNAAMMQRTGMGIILTKVDLAQAHLFLAAVTDLLSNPTYSRKAKEVSRMLSERPFSPQEQLVRHVRFAAEFGPQSALVPDGVWQSAIQYYMIDVIALVASIFATFVFASFCLLRHFARLLFVDNKMKQN